MCMLYVSELANHNWYSVSSGFPDVRPQGLMRGLDPDWGFTSLVEGPVLKI